MAPTRKSGSRLKQARKVLFGGATLTREDSDDELGYDDLPWEWLYEDHKSAPDGTPRSKKRKHAESGSSIVGARMGKFSCKLGDTVLLKAADNQAWVGIICDFRDDEEGEKNAYFMWFSAPGEIRNKAKKRSDFVQNELYLTPSWDWNPLSSINGIAYVLSEQRYQAKYPKGTIPKNSPGYGKTFICRRGCSTRTATYTDEFIWEDVYTESADIEKLFELVKSQTKASRKRTESKPEDEDEDIDYIDKPDYDQEPHTPRKKRRNEDVMTPKSKHKHLTSRKFLTPTHKRIVTKKALEFTPLGTRILSAEVLFSPYAQARNQLHVSSVPAALPCREEEFSEVYTHLERAISAGTGSCIYIAGTPGTGKTATVREVVAQLNAAVLAEELDDFIFVEINGMKVTDPHQSYALLWEALKGDRVSPAHALDLLEREFSTPSPRRVPCVVLMDELDQLVTKNQSVMYNFFNWPQLRHSRLIVLAVANTMDLPERTLSNKISSRLGLHRITFPGYTHAQLIQIVESRLANVPGNIVHPDAIQFASRKVAAVSGDARRCLDICRRAVEIAETEANAQAANGTMASAPNTPSKTGRGLKGTPGRKGGATPAQPMVTIATIKQAISEATSSPLQRYLRSLPLGSKVFLAALLARVRRTGVAEAIVGDVIDEARRMAQMTSLVAVREVLLLEKAKIAEEDVGDFMGPRKAFGRAKNSGLASRMVGMEEAIVSLVDAGMLVAEAKRGERVRRVRLIVGDEDVRLAYKEDEEVRGLGFG